MCEKKILIIGLGKEFGGVEIFIEKTCRELIKKGYCFDFLTYYKVSKLTEDKIESMGSRIYRVERYSVHPIRFVREIMVFYREHTEYGIIHCQASHASMILYVFPIWLKKNVKIIFHSHNSSGEHKILQYVMRKFVNQIVDKRIACCQKAAEWMYGRKESIILYNGIDTSKFIYNEITRNNLRSKFKVDKAIVIGHVGRFEEQKNHKFLVSIFKEALKINYNLVLLLIGEGNFKGEIIELIQKNHLESNVIILPFQKYIQNFYSMMDVFVLPSLFEGFPIVGIEAQAAGLLCFFSDNITKEIAITDLAYFISARETAKDWAKKILNTCYFHNNDLRRNYADLVKKKFNINDTVENISQIYKDIEKK